jgi:hypothetical protein
VASTADTSYAQHIATQAARWGAEQELEACCEWMLEMELAMSGDIEVLQNSRRPKSPSLKEQALAALKRQAVRSVPSLIATEDYETISLALDALPND